jgi:hypothetical protein
MWVTRSAAHALFKLDILLIAETRSNRRGNAKTLGPGVSVLLDCYEVVGLHQKTATTEMRVDLTCQHLEARVLIHGLSAFDVVNDRLRVLLVGGIWGAPMDHEAGHPKASKFHKTLRRQVRKRCRAGYPDKAVGQTLGQM